MLCLLCSASNVSKVRMSKNHIQRQRLWVEDLKALCAFGLKITHFCNNIVKLLLWLRYCVFKKKMAEYG
jgi:hypothetical protein